LIKGYPIDVRASWFARNFWCSEEARIKATMMRFRTFAHKQREIEAMGRHIHVILENRKKTEEIEDFLNLLRTIEPLSFTYRGVKVYFHPDDFRIRKREVSVVEYKTVESKPNRFVYPIGETQLKIYLYGLSKILPKLSTFYSLAKRHKVMYWKRISKRKKKLRLVDVRWVFWDDAVKAEVEDIMDSCFKIWDKKVLPIPPREFKCRQCPYHIRKFCRYFTGQLKLERKNWASRFAKGILKGKTFQIFFDFDDFDERPYLEVSANE